ncbi:MAG: hypothetical protein BWX88_01033 [Planctomycetes bacterium ADurb.Bin126]|nr:MAG: hypothetical protein BWX88_01033 [Planctomycetes bacterium ADurb.Bin126]
MDCTVKKLNNRIGRRARPGGWFSRQCGRTWTARQRSRA